MLDVYWRNAQLQGPAAGAVPQITRYRRAASHRTRKRVLSPTRRPPLADISLINAARPQTTLSGVCGPGESSDHFPASAHAV